MEFNNMLESLRAQIKFYQVLSLLLIGVLAVLAVIAPASIQLGPYVIQDSNGYAAVTRSEPWKLTVSRVEGFLKLFLSTRYEWSKDGFDQKKEALNSLVTDAVAAKLKDSVVSYGTFAKAQDARAFFILEGFRFSNEKHVIEAQISRIIRVGTTGVVTPLFLKISYEDTSVSNMNPYGLRVKAIEESEASQSQGEQSR
jgi:hypothetical protein